MQSQELIAAHSAQRNLEGDQMRPAIGQTVPTEPTEAQRAQHNLTHYPYAAWCELCVAHHARQDGHEPQPHVESGHSFISFDFVYAAQMTKKTSFVHFSSMTGTLVPCMWCRRHRKEDDG